MVGSIEKEQPHKSILPPLFVLMVHVCVNTFV